VNLHVLDNSSRPDLANGTAGAAAVQAPASALVSPEETVAWAVGRFGPRLIVTTGFGMEGCVMIDMLWRQAGANGSVPVHYLDTHFLFPETHALRERLEARYPGLVFINSGTALTPAQQEAAHGPALWASHPDRCCELRKVEPMRRLLSGAEGWMTAVRRSQSAERSATNPVEWDGRFGVTKISPLAHWSRERVWDYAVANGVPYNELHEQGYPTIGCTHCTKPVPGALVTDYSRAGRWAGTGKTECGLHWNEPGAGI
jgi:phosphoadenosine phosphosulfate reductase